MSNTLGFIKFDGPGPVNQIGSYPFMGTPKSSSDDSSKGGEPWTHPGKEPMVGVSSAQVEPLITYKILIAIDSLSFDQNFVPSEPLWAVRPRLPNRHDITKVFSLACLNHHLRKQHERMKKPPTSRKRIRDDSDPLNPADVITEDNFTKHLVFLGFVSDASGPGLLSTGASNPSPKTMLVTMQIKGKLDSAYCWGGGQQRVPLEIGDHVGYVVKRMNKIDQPTEGLVHDNNDPNAAWAQLLNNLGPLQVMPIAARRRFCFNQKTIADDRSLQSLYRKYVNGHFYMAYERTHNAAGEPVTPYVDRYTYRDVNVRSGELPFSSAAYSESKDAPIRSAVTALEKIKKTGPPLPVTNLLFDDLADSSTIDAFSRGTHFVSINNLNTRWAQRDVVVRPVVKIGLVINGGYIMDVYSEAPPRDMVASACTVRNGESTAAQKFYGKNGELYNGDNINYNFAVLKDRYGVHVFVHVPPPTFTLSETDARELDN